MAELRGGQGHLHGLTGLTSAAGSPSHENRMLCEQIPRTQDLLKYIDPYLSRISR